MTLNRSLCWWFLTATAYQTLKYKCKCVFDWVKPSNIQQTIALFISAPASRPLFSRFPPSPAPLSPSTLKRESRVRWRESWRLLWEPPNAIKAMTNVYFFVRFVLIRSSWIKCNNCGEKSLNKIQNNWTVLNNIYNVMYMQHDVMQYVQN